MIVVCLLLILTGSPTVSVSRHRPCGHCFDGLQRSKLRRVHALLFFVRRTAFCVLILLFADLAMLVKVWLYAAMQFAYLTTVWVLRPFEQKKDNVIEIINEVIYFSFWIFLTYFNTKVRFSLTIQYVFIFLIIANCWVNFIFVLLSSINLIKNTNSNSKTQNVIINTFTLKSNLNLFLVKNWRFKKK